MSFQELGLTQKSLSALEKAGYEAPTPIQAQAIPPALAGKDVIGLAATGTGKTLAFVLPLVERIAARGGTQALVLAPTRELAAQIVEQIDKVRHGFHLRAALVIGGVGMHPQIQAFKAGTEIIVATPGRLNDHLQQGTARLDHVRTLVLDEADRMLDMGFLPQLRRVMQHLPRQRQSLLFSATMAGEVADFARTHLHDPVRVEVVRSGATAERAIQQVFLIGETEKTALLMALLEQDDLSTLVFARTRRRADRIAKALGRAGHEVAVIHSDRSQGQRRSALDAFKSGEVRVLVATDIAARGIDVADIGHVVNFDLPHVPEDYVHRIGRTARMAASGRASSFAAPEEHDLLRGIEKLTRKSVDRAEVPRQSEVFKAEVRRKAEAPQHRPHRGQAPRRQSGGQTSRQQQQGAGGGEAKSLGKWKPRRRR
ncbi:MAG TPA: DEAD/DEAH box helicase [Myxococcales bacterium]|jgi:ATP-dependent RNA helicase RhlE|nr:DEAD/DEAH box helicase [Myxococcales bacterium]HZX65241.1 DEAD/DEAH box helicase [Myxococcales bacterium]